MTAGDGGGFYGRMTRPVRSLMLAAAAAFLAVASVRAAEPGDIVAGRRIAQANCGGCHAVDAGPSPYADAPPFRRLYRRYRPGHLDPLLAEGMLAPSDMADESGKAYHPRMPSVSLDADQIDQLKAYLKSLDPRRAQRRRR